MMVPGNNLSLWKSPSRSQCICRRWFWLMVVASLGMTLESFSPDDTRRRLPGIWKLTSNALPYEQDIRSKLKGLMPDEQQEDILIKLNPDGSFKQCNEGYTEGRWLSGKWELSEESNTLMLAMRRQYFGPRFDVLLEGNLPLRQQEDDKEQPQPQKEQQPPQDDKQLQAWQTSQVSPAIKSM